jgi:hypothetical protein
MALSFGNDQELVEVICSKDESVTCDADSFQEYLKTLDESLLGLNPDIQPTRFVMKKTLPYAATKKIKNEQIGYKDGEMELRLGFIIEEVRTALVDIKNPGSGLEFKKDGDGGASKSLIEKLEAAGIVQELYTARQSAIKSVTPKKS